MRRNKPQEQVPTQDINGTLVIVAHSVSGHLERIRKSVEDTPNTVLYAKNPADIYRLVRDSRENPHRVDVVITGGLFYGGIVDVLLSSPERCITYNDIGERVHAISPDTVVVAYCRPNFTQLRRHDGIDIYIPPDQNSENNLVRLLTDAGLIQIQGVNSQNPDIRHEAREFFRGYGMRFSDEQQQVKQEDVGMHPIAKYVSPTTTPRKPLRSGHHGIHPDA